MMEDKSNLNVFRVPAEEIQRRVKRAQQEMRTRNMDALFVVQRVDVLYFSGTAQNGCVFIPAEGKPLLLVKKFFPRALEESPFDNILQIQSIREIPGMIIDYQGRIPSRLGFEWDVMPVREFQFYARLFADAECVDGSSVIYAVRSTKSAWELAQMEKAAEKSLQLFDFIGKHVNAGDTDVKISSRAESFARSIGHGAVLRIRDYQKSGLPLSHLSESGMGTGKVLAFPSVREGTCLIIEPGKRLNRGEPITMESRFFLNGYHVNEARVFSMGPLAPAFDDKAQGLMELQQGIIAEIKPGIRAARLFDLFIQKARSIGMDRDDQAPGMGGKRMIGNGIGLELVEPPLIAAGSQQILKQGMVLSLSSENRVDDQHLMRARDVVLVTETGHRTITRLPPHVFICSKGI